MSNALVICPEERDTSPKGLLIPHVTIKVRNLMIKWRISLWEEPAYHQLVGEVMAHQGYDG